MLMKGIQKQQVTIEVDEREIFQEVERRIRSHYNIGQAQWLRYGKLYHEEHTSHAYDVCDGPAKPKQLKGFELIETLREVLIEKN